MVISWALKYSRAAEEFPEAVRNDDKKTDWLALSNDSNTPSQKQGKTAGERTTGGDEQRGLKKKHEEDAEVFRLRNARRRLVWPREPRHTQCDGDDVECHLGMRTTKAQC